MATRHDHLIERAAARLTAGANNKAPLPQVAPGIPASEQGFPAAGGTAGTAAGPAARPAPSTAGADAGNQALALAHDAPAALPARPDEAPEVTLAVMEQAGLVVGRSTRTRISEEFRIAVGRVARVAEAANVEGVRNPVILVTSAKPGEGKTFTALNLAAVLAQNGPRPVVLVDSDFKQDSISDLLGLGNRRGLFDVLAPETADLRSLLVTTEVPGLSVLPSGSVMQDDLGAGFSRPVGPRVEALAESMPDSVLVLDAPPCLSTSDASTLAVQAGQVLLVVEAGRTQRAEVEAALDFVRACPVVTMVLNKVRQSNRQTFGSYDYLSGYQ